MRVLAKKIGMTQVFVEGEDGVLEVPVGVSVLQVVENIVVSHRIKEKDGYNALVVGYFFKPVHKISKPILGFVKKHLRERELYPTKFYEVKTDNLEKFPVGSSLKAELFNGIDLVDVQGKTKGRGFAGVVKRWDFSGGPAAHGSKFHRRPGSIGHHTFPAKVWKGKKMAGHYGNETVTILNLELVRILPEYDLILVKGGVPGHKGGFVFVRPAIYKYGGEK